MRILVVGSDEVWSIEKFYVKYLGEIPGNVVDIFPIQSFFLSYYNRSVLQKLLFRIGLSGIYRRLNQALTKKVSDFRPDWVFVFKGMEIFPGTLAQLRNKGVRLANYNPDNPFIFTGFGSGNKHVRESLPFYDIHFTYDRGIAEQIRREIHDRVYVLPFAYELDEDLLREMYDQKEVNRLCFIGNMDPMRMAVVKELAVSVEVDLYGHGWHSLQSLSNVNVFSPIYGKDYWLTLHRYRAQLNLMRVHNLQSHNMRTFEVPAAGAIGLFPDTPDHRLYFEEGKEVFLYGSIPEAVEKARKILRMSEAEALDVRQRARRRVVESHYDYKSRANEVNSVLKAHDA